MALIGLAGCASTGPTASEIGVKPANWQEATRQAARSTYLDPYSVRDAEISAPVPASMVFDGVTPIPHSGWMVCVRANAKNRMGAYTGQRVTAFLFQGGRIVNVINEGDAAAVVHHCGSSFAPFSV